MQLHGGQGLRHPGDQVTGDPERFLVPVALVRPDRCGELVRKPLTAFAPGGARQLLDHLGRQFSPARSTVPIACVISARRAHTAGARPAPAGPALGDVSARGAVPTDLDCPACPACVPAPWLFIGTRLVEHPDLPGRPPRLRGSMRISRDRPVRPARGDVLGHDPAALASHAPPRPAIVTLSWIAAEALATRRGALGRGPRRASPARLLSISPTSIRRRRWAWLR